MCTFAGQGGVGKSTSLKQLALLWANRKSEHLKQFDFVLHIALKSVKNNEPIEEIILKQHKGLSRNHVNQTDFAKLLNGEYHCKVLLMLDGHDEYTPGTNNDVDEAITKHAFPGCCILLTSLHLHELRSHVDIEAEITGLESEIACQHLISMATESNIISHWPEDYGILKVPIMLHMICVLYQ